MAAEEPRASSHSLPSDVSRMHTKLGVGVVGCGSVGCRDMDWWDVRGQGVKVAMAGYVHEGEGLS